MQEVEDCLPSGHSQPLWLCLFCELRRAAGSQARQRRQPYLCAVQGRLLHRASLCRAAPAHPGALVPPGFPGPAGTCLHWRPCLEDNIIEADSSPRVADVQDYILAQRKRAAQPAIGSLEAHTAHQNASQAGSTPSLAYLAPQQPQQRQQPPSFLPRVSQMQQWQDSAVPSQQSGASSSDNIPSPMSAAGQADGQGAGFPLPLMQGRAPFGEQPRRVPPSPFGRVQRDPNSRAKGHNSSEDGSDRCELLHLVDMLNSLMWSNASGYRMCRYDGGESNSNSDGSGSDSNGSSGGQRGMPMQT